MMLASLIWMVVLASTVVSVLKSFLLKDHNLKSYLIEINSDISNLPKSEALLAGLASAASGSASDSGSSSLGEDSSGSASTSGEDSSGSSSGSGEDSSVSASESGEKSSGSDSASREDCSGSESVSGEASSGSGMATPVSVALPSSPVSSSISSSSAPPSTTASSTINLTPSSCSANACCVADIDGLMAKACFKNGTIESITAQEKTIVRIEERSPTVTRITGSARLSLGRIKVLDLNVWGFKVWAEDKEERLAAIAEHLQQGDYDLVTIQELWYNQDFQLIKDTFPFSTYYGSPYSLLCPSIANDRQYSIQAVPIDCNGLTVLSRTLLTDIQYEFFNDRVQGEWREYFGRRGLLRARTVIDGKKVSVISNHFATWYSDTEDPEAKWSTVREAQADQLIGMVKVEEKDYEADLVIVGGDMNSTPGSAVMKKLLGAGLIDAVAEKKGDHAKDGQFATWGNPSNTYTFEDEDMRIDYIMYKGLNGKYQVTKAGVLDLKTEIDGQQKSVSDHMGIEVVIKIL